MAQSIHSTVYLQNDFCAFLAGRWIPITLYPLLPESGLRSLQVFSKADPSESAAPIPIQLQLHAQISCIHGSSILGSHMNLLEESLRSYWYSPLSRSARQFQDTHIGAKENGYAWRIIWALSKAKILSSPLLKAKTLSSLFMKKFCNCAGPLAIASDLQAWDFSKDNILQRTLYVGDQTSGFTFANGTDDPQGYKLIVDNVDYIPRNSVLQSGNLQLRVYQPNARAPAPSAGGAASAG